MKMQGPNYKHLIHCLSSVYSVTIPLNVSSLLVAHHQEVKKYIYMQQMVRDIYIYIYTHTRIMIPAGDGQLASPKHV
jgi:hypothetical protein